MKVTVTGGNGFLGSNAVRKLLKEGHEVMVLSNNSNNIQDLLPKIKYRELTSNQLKEYLYPIEDYIREFSPDVLIHFAWSGGNSHKDVNSPSQFSNISIGTKLIQSISYLEKKVKFVGIGSFSEYGSIKSKAKEEDQENPVNLYGVSKYSLKMCSKILCEKNGIDWVWVRPCYVFGKGDVNTRLIPKLIDKFSKNERVELDSCNSIIDYIHIEDFSDLLYKLVTSENNGTYNICSGKEYSVKSLIDTIKKLTKTSSDVVYDPNLDRGLPKYICGDNTKILNTTKSNLKYTLEEGLKKTIQDL